MWHIKKIKSKDNMNTFMMKLFLGKRNISHENLLRKLEDC